MEIINMKHIQKIFYCGKNETKALSGVNFTMNEGESVAIMGVSGSGKSTLLKIISMLDCKTFGEYYLIGEDVSSFSNADMAKKRASLMGIIFQSIELVENESVKSNISLGLYVGDKYKIKEFNEIIDRVLQKVGIAHLKNKKVKYLSGGEKQRVAIARAIVNDPKIILADEPTSALDSKTADEIIQLLKDLQSNGKTLIVVTHDINVANKLDKIVTIKDGVIFD